MAITPGKNRTKTPTPFLLLSVLFAIVLSLGLYASCVYPRGCKQFGLTYGVLGGILIAVGLAALANLLKAGFMDPVLGFLPRRLENEEPPNSRESMNPITMIDTVDLNGYPVYIKYCATCFIVRSIRASHCNVCNRCVDRKDHHCPWLNNCVGKRNYKYFFFFLFTCSLYAVYGAALCLYSVFAFEDTSMTYENGAAMFNVLMGVGSIWNVSHLLFFHTKLIMGGWTTKDYFDRNIELAESSKLTPYRTKASGCCTCINILCGPDRPSFLEPKNKPLNVFWTGEKILIVTSSKSPLSMND